MQIIRHHWLTVAFILGFVTDLLLLNRIDDAFDNFILFFYTIVATFSILFLYIGVAEKGPVFLSKALKKYSPVLMQYAFGGLLSGMLIFYGRSGDWFTNTPFMLLILLVIFGNEVVEKRSDRIIYQLSLYYVGIFSYVVLQIPVVLGRMGDGIFIFSGLVSLVVVMILVRTLYLIVPNFMALNTKKIILTIGFIYIGFNSLYFLNAIPPIPLSLTDLEIVHSVERVSSGGYRIAMEQQPWYRRLPFTTNILHPTESSVSCFARVYAPTNLSTKIFHRWEFEDMNGEWQEHFRLGYGISGVNKKGYGGYTSVENFHDGHWRCSVETERGQVLGRKVVLIETSGVAGEIIFQIEHR